VRGEDYPMPRFHMTIPALIMAVGTAIAVYPHHGFWWAVAYGLVCEGWWAYRLAEWLLR
jgi:hypothetical protein